MKRIASLMIIALAACTTAAPASDNPTAALGQLAYVNGLTVRPLAVIEDSRCSINAVCVWTGRIVVRTEIRGGPWRQIRNLELGQPQPIADGTLTLVGIMPAKLAGAEADPRAYRFTFDFQGGL